MKNKFVVSLFCVSSFIFSQDVTRSISLKEAINFGLKNSFAVRQADKDLSFAEEKRWETTATGLPQIDVSLDYNHWLKQNVTLLPAKMLNPMAPEGVFTPVKFGTKQNVKGDITLKQLIFNGSYLVGLQSAKTYMKISAQAKKKTKLSTREAIINAYGNLLLADESIKILTKNKNNIDKTLEETKEIYKNGFTEQESVEQLEITQRMLENNLRNAKRMRIIAVQMLNIAMGNKNNDNLILTDNLEKLTSNIDLSLLLKSFNINDNIDYQMALNNREAKRLLWKLEKSKYLPTLSAFVNYGFNANSDEFTFLDKDQKWYDSSIVGVRLNIPIFSSMQRMARVNQARINVEKIDVQLQEIEQKLTLQAEASKSEFQLSVENLANAKKNMELAERIETKNRIKFKEGIASSFDLFQAQNQLYTQQNNYIKAMLDVVEKKAKLETILNTPIKR